MVILISKQNNDQYVRGRLRILTLSFTLEVTAISFKLVKRKITCHNPLILTSLPGDQGNSLFRMFNILSMLLMYTWISFKRNREKAYHFDIYARSIARYMYGYVNVKQS